MTLMTRKSPTSPNRIPGSPRQPALKRLVEQSLKPMLLRGTKPTKQKTVTLQSASLGTKRLSSSSRKGAITSESSLREKLLRPNADGMVRYVTSFVITKPVDMAKASGMLWHDVPNRGRPLTINELERGFGDVGLAIFGTNSDCRWMP